MGDVFLMSDHQGLSKARLPILPPKVRKRERDLQVSRASSTQSTAGHGAHRSKAMWQRERAWLWTRPLFTISVNLSLRSSPWEARSDEVSPLVTHFLIETICHLRLEFVSKTFVPVPEGHGKLTIFRTVDEDEQKTIMDALVLSTVV